MSSICFICHEIPDVAHNHHPVLQSVGGKDEGTVPLCPDCHNSVHREINRLCALYRQGKKGGTSSVNWKTCRHSQEVENATKIVLTGVKSILTFDGKNKMTKINIEVTPEVYQMIMALKQKTGITSIPKVVKMCIVYTARHSKLV